MDVLAYTWEPKAACAGDELTPPFRYRRAHACQRPIVDQEGFRSHYGPARAWN